MSNRFRQFEDEYFKLRGRLAAGRITQHEFENLLSGLMIQDTQGRYWAIGRMTGKWNVYDGLRWSLADPHATGVTPGGPVLTRPGTLPETGRQPVAPAEPITRPVEVATTPPPVEETNPASSKDKKKDKKAKEMEKQERKERNGGGLSCRSCGCGCLTILILVALLGGSYFTLRNGIINQRQVLNLVGMGPSQIEVSNFRDDAIQVNVTELDVAPDAIPFASATNLKAFDVKAVRVPNPGRFRIDFTRGGTNVGSCTLITGSGDHYQFVTLPDKIIINRLDNTPIVGNDMLVGTSNLCH